VLETIVAERVYSAIVTAWPVDEQQAYLGGLSAREAFHVAETPEGGIVGYQSLDRYSTILSSMAHVGQLGTFVVPDWRGRGVGRALFDATLRFARAAAYRKLVIQVRASNAPALAFYRQAGFTDCGRLVRQVIVDGREDDEVIMERWLDSPSESAAAAIRS
jgi:ribosomal protein S18 acetylase RimI-like enzyme